MERLGKYTLIGQSPRFLSALDTIRKLAACDATVLIQGETGTGKELAARTMHYLSVRSKFPFIPVNCGALPDGLLESELFGHEQGAFTDARRSSEGLVRQADGGTLFLDEVEALSPRAQVMLLRFLQDGEYRSVGGHSIRTANVRAIAASNTSLAKMVENGAFRQDLLFRLDVLSVHLPPLRERAGDACLLAEAFAVRYAAHYGQEPRSFDADSIAYLAEHRWPGNVRELENLIHRHVAMTETEVLHLRPALPDHGPMPANAVGNFREAKASAVAQFERAYLADLLTKTQGNIAAAARMCGKERSALGKLAKKYQLSSP